MKKNDEELANQRAADPKQSTEQSVPVLVPTHTARHPAVAELRELFGNALRHGKKRKLINVQGWLVQSGEEMWFDGPLRGKTFQVTSSQRTCKDCGRTIQPGEIYAIRKLMRGSSEVICTDHASIERQIAFEKMWQNSYDESYIAVDPYPAHSGKAAFTVHRVLKRTQGQMLAGFEFPCEHTLSHIAEGFALVKALQWLNTANVVSDNEIIVIQTPEQGLSRRLETGSTFGENESLWKQLNSLIARYADRLVFRAQIWDPHAVTSTGTVIGTSSAESGPTP